MDAALRLTLYPHTRDRSFRFNPCFSGCRPATFHVFINRNTCLGVSILVLVDAALRQIIKYPERVIEYVSILVLVDAALRLHVDESVRLARGGFQSLF